MVAPESIAIAKQCSQNHLPAPGTQASSTCSALQRRHGAQGDLSSAIFRQPSMNCYTFGMKYAAVLMALALSVNAQSPVNKASTQGQITLAKVDPKLHADAIRLVEVSGAKQLIQDNLEKLVDEAQKSMMDKCQRCSPEFGKEWRKRFLKQTNINDYLDVYVRVYEKYFTDSEINELIALQKEPSGATPSPVLKAKLTAVMPSAMADAIGDCGKIGAKLGAEIGAEVEREHPEYLKPTSDAPKP